MNKTYTILLSAILMLVLDAIYLNVMKEPFSSMVVSIQHVVMKVKMLPALLCYLLLIFGLNYFILDKKRSVFDAFLLGLVIYGVFDSTNMVIFKKYKWHIGLIDALWGGVLFASVTAILYYLE